MFEIPRSYYKPTETQRAELAAYRDRLREQREKRVNEAARMSIEQKALDQLRNLLVRAEREAKSRRFEK